MQSFSFHKCHCVPPLLLPQIVRSRTLTVVVVEYNLFICSCRGDLLPRNASLPFGTYNTITIIVYFCIMSYSNSPPSEWLLVKGQLNVKSSLVCMVPVAQPYKLNPC